MSVVDTLRDELLFRWRGAALGGTVQHLRTILPFVYLDRGSDIPYWTLTDGHDTSEGEHAARVVPGVAGLAGEWRPLEHDIKDARDVLARMSAEACLLCGTEGPSVPGPLNLERGDGTTHRLPVSRCRVCLEPMTVPLHTALYLLGLPADRDASWSPR